MDENKIEKLQLAAQWPRWKFQVKVSLNAIGVYIVVTGEWLKPVFIKADSETEAQARARYSGLLADWCRADGKAQKIIVSALGQQPMQLIMRFETAAEMWRKLVDVYEQKSETQVYVLQQRFFSACMEPSENIVTHISKLEDIAQQLHDQGENVSTTMLISKILMTLPPKFSHFHSAWESTSIENRTIENLTARLMVEENRLSGTNSLSTEQSESNAMAMKSRTQHTKKSSSSGKQKPTGKCYFCNERGHFKRDCPKRNRSMNNNTTSSDLCDAFTSVAGVDSLAVCADDRWFLDTGASDHMTHRREWFESYTPIQQKPIRVGNGNVIYASGIGNIRIKVYDGMRWCDKQLINVLYAPKLSMNLFSAGSALDINKGLILETNSHCCSFRLNGVTVAVGERSGRLYEMQINVLSSGNTQSQAMSVCTLREWHEKLAHQNIKHVKSFLAANNIKISNENATNNFFCKDCVIGKQHRASYKSSAQTITAAGELIVSDVCGPMQVASISGARYFLVFKDQFSHYRVVYFMKEKSQVKEYLKQYLQNVLTQTGYVIKCFRSDNGLEFMNSDVSKMLKDRGIQHQRTVPFTPQQNGSAEREMRTIVEAARTMLHARNLPKKLWAEAVNTAVYVLNRTGTSSVPNRTPFQAWFNKSPDVNRNNMHVFGTAVYVHVPKEKRRKWDVKSTEGVFVGYATDTKGFRVWYKCSDKIVIACDVVFEKFDVIEHTQSGSKLHESDVVFDDTSSDYLEQETVSTNTPNSNEFESLSEEEHFEPAEDDINNIVSSDRVLRDRSNMPRPVYVEEESIVIDDDDSILCVAEIIEPLTYQQAIKNEHSTKWINAMTEEMQSLYENKTWTLVDLPPGRKAIDNRWVFRLKRKPNGDIDRFKARLVVRGFSQVRGIDYEETFSPVVKFSSVRLILAVAAAEKLFLRQFDIKTAFLYGDLDEEIYMEQPIGFSDSTKKVCRLNRSLYGLKQASRCWNHKFTNFLKRFNLSASKADSCVFVGCVSGRKIVLAIYIDDGLIAATHESDIQKLLSELNEQFKFKSGALDSFLGIEILRTNDGSVHINQNGYAKRILQKFKMFDCNPVATPADPHHSMCTNGEPALNVPHTFPYREAVGSLMFLATVTRPDIAFAVNNASRHLENPKQCHWTAVKRIFKYLKGTIGYGITFKSSLPIHLSIYSDADYGGDLDTRRSTTGYVVMIGGGAISWCSQRQPTVALSTTESEYIAASQTLKELIWVNRLLREIVPTVSGVPRMNIDNQSAIKLIKNPEFHKRSKHIDIKFHFIKEQYEKQIFEPCYVSTDDQIADICTKPLTKEKFVRFRNSMGVQEK